MEPTPSLRLWTLAAVITSVFAVTHHDDFLEYRLVIPVLVAGGFLFSYWRRGKRNWWVKIILGLLCLEVGRQFLRGVLADPYHTSVPLTVLLLWLQTLHAFDVPARRDLLFGLLSSLILMAVAAAFAVDLSFLVYLGLYAFVAVQTLVHNAWHGMQELAVDSAGTASQQPPTWARPTGRREGRAGAGGRPSRTMLWAANHLLVLVIVGAGVIFVLTPRFEGLRLTALPFSPQRVLLDLFAGRIVNPAYGDARGGNAAAPPPWNPSGYFGFSATVDLRLRGRLDETVVMRVRATRQFNWRALVFDSYTGTGWRIADPRVSQIEGTEPPLAITMRHDEVMSAMARRERVAQSFYIDVEQPNVVFAAPVAELLYLPSGRVYLDRYGSMRLPNTLKAGTVYSVVSRTLVPSPESLRRATGALPQFIQERYLTLPELPARVRELAGRVTAGLRAPYDRVTAVQAYLHQNYRYDLTIPPQRGRGDAVDYFLFVERRGYCEQFASAMTVLLRAAGVPARLVTGYTPGTLNPLTGLLEVRNSDAHAWVEAYFSGLGWVEFEPTPGFLGTGALGATPNRYVWQDLMLLLARYVRVLAARSPTVAAAFQTAERMVAWSVLLVAVGFAVVATGRLTARRRGGSKRSPVALAEVYHDMARLLAQRGFRRSGAETVEEFRARVEAAGTVPEVGDISRVVEASVYGGLRPTVAEIEQARAQLASLRGRLKGARGLSRR